MLAIIVGLLFVALGCTGFAYWWPEAMILFKGFVPLMIVCGGLIAVAAGITTVIDDKNKKAKLKKTEEGEK